MHGQCRRQRRRLCADGLQPDGIDAFRPDFFPAGRCADPDHPELYDQYVALSLCLVKIKGAVK